MRGGFRGLKTRANFTLPRGGARGGFDEMRGDVTDRRGGQAGHRGGFNDRRGEPNNRRGDSNNRRGGFTDRRGGEYDDRRGGGFYDRRGAEYDDRRGGEYDFRRGGDHDDRRGDGYDDRQVGRGRGRGKVWRKAKQDIDARPDNSDLPFVEADKAEQHPTDGPSSKRLRPTSPGAAGHLTFVSALTFANTVRTKSGGWRLGAPRALMTERAPRPLTLYEAVRLAEVEALAELAGTIETALLKEARETHALLAEYRVEKDKDAPPATAVAPPQAPAPSFTLDAAAIALIGNQIIAQLKQ